MSGVSGDRVMVQTTTNILIVDDERYMRELASRWLASMGWNCVTADDAQAAWECLQSQEIQVVTLDINMPGRSGLDLLAQISAEQPETQIVMLTARGESQTAIDALTRGACGYLVKPVEREELVFQVERALERRRMLVQQREHTQQLERKVREQTCLIRQAHEETIHRLVTASMYRDEETGAHVKRVGLYSELITEAIGWPLEQVEQIRMAAPMHDVGKIGVPDAILQKPAKLSPAEYEIMQQHTVIGANILANSQSPMLQMAGEIALCHHERWDGTGYPNGLRESAIPEAARIVAIVDVYDALTHDRVYRPALPEHEALEIIEQGHGTHFDPILLRVFFSLLPELRRLATENPDEFATDTELTEELALTLQGTNGDGQIRIPSTCC